MDKKLPIKPRFQHVLLASAGLLTAVLVTAAVLLHGGRGKEPANAPVPRSGLGSGDGMARGVAPKQASVDHATLEAALAEKNLAWRNELLRQWALSVSLNDVEEAVGRIEGISDLQLQSEAGRALVSRFTKESPDAAAALLSRLAKPLPGSLDVSSEWLDLFGRVAAQWAKANLNSAANWVQALPEGPAKSQAFAQLIYQWMETDPKAAATYAASRNDAPLLTNIALRWAQSDPRAATAWVSGLPADEAGVESGVEPRLAAIWAKHDPQAAAAYAANLPPGNPQNQSVLAVASIWASTDPAQVAAWLRQFPDDPMSAQAMTQLINIWAGSNADQASQWLKTLPQTHARDFAVGAFSDTIASSSPGAAFQWAQTISDEAMRDNQLQSVARIWLAQDPAAAQQQIAKSNLSQEIKNQLLPATGK